VLSKPGSRLANPIEVTTNNRFADGYRFREMLLLGFVGSNGWLPRFLEYERLYLRAVAGRLACD
jgi:hypothetical protein